MENSVFLMQRPRAPELTEEKYMSNEGYLSYKYYDDQSKMRMLRKRFFPKPFHQGMSEYDNWTTKDPFDIPTFSTYPRAPITRKEIFNFELIKADHVKNLVMAGLPKNIRS